MPDPAGGRLEPSGRAGRKKRQPNAPEVEGFQERVRSPVYSDVRCVIARVARENGAQPTDKA